MHLLPLKGFVLRLIEVLCHDFTFKVFLIVDLEGPTAHGPTDNVGKALALGVLQDVVELPRKGGNASGRGLTEEFGSWRRRGHGVLLGGEGGLLMIHGGVDHLDLLGRIVIRSGHGML